MWYILWLCLLQLGYSQPKKRYSWYHNNGTYMLYENTTSMLAVPPGVNMKAPYPKQRLRIAMVTAGAIRSFAFVVRSWERYILTSEVSLFAHVVTGSDQCPITMWGLERIKELATDLEIGYTKSTLEFHPGEQQNMQGWCETLGGTAHSVATANIRDMYDRRSRAFAMAEAYALRNKFEWDLVVFVRVDSGYYSPKLDYHGFFQTLKNFQIYSKGRKGLIIPHSCGFGGFCDRFAVGFPSEMRVFFKHNLLHETLRAVESDNNGTLAQYAV